MVWKNKIKFSNAFCAINALQNNHEIFPQQKSRQKDGKSVCNIHPKSKIPTPRQYLPTTSEYFVTHISQIRVIILISLMLTVNLFQIVLRNLKNI